MTSYELANFKFYLLEDARRTALEAFPAEKNLEVEHVVYRVSAAVLETLLASRFTGPNTDAFLVKHRGDLCRIASNAAVAVGRDVLEVFGREVV